MQVGGPDVAGELAELVAGLHHQRAQGLRRALALPAGTAHVRLHVLPLDAGAHVSLGGGFVLAELPGSEQVLCLDNTARGQIADHPEWIRLMLRKWESLLGEALAERASLDLVNKLKVTP
ncbi:Scr1 family TA system antitoxin-like transcriptional regulator [Micromonospora sp. WMMD735]|uniref:Scr1 family TA system antitoxin-like transcriptional regulator n=1 Tax=Micromonospora sp. WMMD735 TaxID=3404130 RepID=UPI003B9509F3